jgi:hypothetical protein
MRGISRTVDGFIEEIKTPKEWDDLARDLQTDVANAVTEAFVAIEEGRRSIREEIIELLDEEGLDLPAPGSAASEIDLIELWEGKPLDPKAGVAGRAFRAGLSGVRGAQGGVMMFGMMGQFLPTASAVVLASNPVLLGAGALFGGIQLFDERKRKVTARRQAARMQLRQFVDDVQFEVGNEISNAIRSLQRELRDDFGGRLTELQRTYADAAQTAQQAAQQDQQQAATRLQELQQLLAGLDEIERSLPARVAAS